MSRLQLLLLALALERSCSTRPNIILLLTDDQDVLLGGMNDMAAAKKFLIDEGMSFTAGYSVDPICCPSRTALISGRYPHNLEEEVPSVGWCGDLAADGLDNNTWIHALHEAGYATALHGKYHNQPPTAYIPRGYDDFFVLLDECNYQDNHWVINDGPGGRPRQQQVLGYMTSVIGNRSVAWLASAAANASAGGQPFFLYIAPHAPHMLTTPAPWYMDTPLPSQRAPRTPAYNHSGAGKQWLTASLAPLDARMEAAIDHIYTLRHRALLSVDDILREAIAALPPAVLANTYVMMTSDHGYNLGTFRLAVEKFHFLENDINVPFLVRGPGVAPGSTSPALVSQLDIGATILDLAGVAPLPTDGRSFASELHGGGGSGGSGGGAWPRDRVVIEYYGGGYVVRGPCNESCGICGPEQSQLLDAPSNTWSALRIRNATADFMYAEFRASGAPAVPASTNWTELYDLAADPFQLVNLAPTANASFLAQLRSELFALATCEGAACP